MRQREYTHIAAAAAAAAEAAAAATAPSLTAARLAATAVAAAAAATADSAAVSEAPFATVWAQLREQNTGPRQLGAALHRSSQYWACHRERLSQQDHTKQQL